jgi:hypothetical protein
MIGISASPWVTVEVEVGPPILFGAAEGFERRCVPILSGRVSGRVTGTVLPGGTDWQKILPGGTSDLEAHYGIETDAGDTIEVWSRGIRSGPADAMQALLAGEQVDPSLIYFRTAVRMSSAAPALADLTARRFVGVGTREPTRVRIDLFAVE